MPGPLTPAPPQTFQLKTAEAAATLTEADGSTRVDTVVTAFDIPALPSTIENLQKTGTRDIKVVSNDQPNQVTGNAGANRLESGGGDDTVSGAAAAVLIYSNKGADVLSGGGDQDKLFGGQGDDWVSGGSGDDRLQGNRGDDTLVGGGGADRFEFGGQSGHDVIVDFAAGGGHLDFAAPETATTSAAGHLLPVHAGGSVEIVGESLES